MSKRNFDSFIQAFEAWTDNTGSPLPFRRWAGIATIAAVLEQKVWIQTAKKMYPNLYTFLVGPPAAGKSYIMSKARELISAMPDPHIAPTSINTSSLIDQLSDSKRHVMSINPPLEYNSMTIMVGEFGTFIAKHEDDMMAILTDMYDVEPYGQRRRGGDLKIKIASPQLNMVMGVTPSVLLKVMPDIAWDQGFASRLLLVFSEDKTLIDDFAETEERSTTLLVEDLKSINSLVGQFRVSQAYRDAVTEWREAGENPRPKHPRLVHYCSRRKAHLYRLSMIASIDRGNDLHLGIDDFNTAKAWLEEIEKHMGKIFQSPAEASDIRAVEEIEHHIMEYNIRIGKWMAESYVVNFARERVRGTDVLRILDIIIRTQKVRVKEDAQGMRWYMYNPDGRAVAAVEAEVKVIEAELKPLD